MTRRQWCYIVGEDGQSRELFNGARTAHYLDTLGRVLGDGPTQVLITDIYDFGGCEGYAYSPPCALGETTNPSHGVWPSGATERNSFSVPDNANFSAPTQLDLRGAVGGVASASGTRTLAAHRDNGGSNIAFIAQLSTGDIPQLITTTNGSTQTTATCDVVLTTTDDLVLWRITWRSSDGRVQFFRKLGVASDDIVFERDSDLNWDQIGADEVASTAALFNATAPLAFGNTHASTSAVANPFIGRMYAFSLATTIDGAPIVAWGPPNITNPNATTFTASTGQTVTVTRAASGAQLSLFVDTIGGWDAYAFTTPDADPAPWYSATYPESAEALGFWIDEWTGLDDQHIARPSTPVGNYGAQLGRIGAAQRTMKLNVILVAQSEKAMEYLFAWLGSTLNSVCSSCESVSWLIRRFCPDVPDLWDGVVEARRVGLVEGLTWEAPVLERESCYIRRASFTVAAADPCFYMPDTAQAAAVQSAVPVDCLNALLTFEGRNPCRPTCLELDNTDCRTVFTIDVDPLGAAGPVLTLENANDEHSLPIRVICYADPLEVGVTPNPCGLERLGEVYVNALPPWSTFVWDVAGRRVLYRDHSTGYFVNGAPYLLPNDPPLRRDFALHCGQAHIVIEPGTLCLDEVAVDTWEAGGITFAAPHFPTASLAVQERIGCP